MDKEQVFQVLAGCTVEVLPELARHSFAYHDQLQELGANSMDRADIVMLALERLSLAIPRTETFGPKNLGELADLLHAKLTRK